MTIDELGFKLFNLRIDVENDNEVLFKLEEMYSTLNDYLSELENRSKDIENLLKKTRTEIIFFENLLLQVLRESLYGDIESSNKTFGEFMDNFYKHIKNTGFINVLEDVFNQKSYEPENNVDSNHYSNHKRRLFRGRIIENYHNVLRENLFHIPFSLREKVSTQRFSLPGLPSLYLSSCSYTVWCELMKPNLSDFIISGYEIQNKLHILNLAIDYTDIGKFLEWSKTDERVIPAIENFLLFTPLLIATSLKVNQRNREFKSEYIIPQLLMRHLKKYNIDGISYYSKEVNSKVYDTSSKDHLINYVFPAYQNDSNEEHSSKLMKSFKVSEPLNFRDFTLIDDVSRRTHTYRTTPNLKIFFPNAVEYWRTPFYQLDMYFMRQGEFKNV